MVTIIVALNEDRVIGNDNQIPWHLTDDLKHFKDTTLGHAVIMGRKTWEGIPNKYRPLSGRMNIILTKDVGKFTHDYLLLDKSQRVKEDHPTIAVPDIEEAIDLASMMENEIFVIGGEQIYTQFLEKNLVDRVIATMVYGHHYGNRFFPILTGNWTPKFLRKEKEFQILEFTKGKP